MISLKEFENHKMDKKNFEENVIYKVRDNSNIFNGQIINILLPSFHSLY